MRLFLLAFLFSISAHALDSYPIEVGIGSEYCAPNQDGQKVCEGISPLHKRFEVPMITSADQPVSYGNQTISGTFRDLGFDVVITITHFENLKADDILALALTTWNLHTPQNKFKVETEIFANSPQNLNRMNLIGHPIGNEDFYTNVILGIRPAKVP
jgi:hypothetical protein